MKKTLYIVLISILFFSCATTTDVSSPDGSLSVRFEQMENGGIGFSVSRDGRYIIAPSPLGFLSEEFPLGNGWHITGTKKKHFSSSWETVWGEERVIKDEHSSLVVHLRQETGIMMDVEFRVFNDGFAFRYIFPEQEQKQLTITDELTSYCFTQEAQAWSIPWRTEYYEGLWEKRTIKGPSDQGLSTNL